MSQVHVDPPPQLQRVLKAYILAGLLFMVLPGTFLGVWNLISISGERSPASLSAAWLQAHGHAQMFGWIGTFIIGIGYFSLSKMGAIAPFAVSRGWSSWVLWTAGAALRWFANVSLWNWRVLLPVSAALELAAFLIFFITVSRHPRTGRGIEVWMLLVIASTVGFLFLLLFNAGITAYLAIAVATPEIPHWLDQRFLVLATWGVPVLAVWGFNARWLPAFMGLKPGSRNGLRAALALCGLGVISALFGNFHVAAAALTMACATAAVALNVFERAHKAPNLQGVHPSFGIFVRMCYGWLLVAPMLSMWAVTADREGGIWGASRHALTVGFLAGMIFAIGPRILPAFTNRQLFSPKIMLAACATLNLGCFLRVASEIPAYEGFAPAAWRVLPVSAVLELAAVSLFALNLMLTMARRSEAAPDKRLYNISFSGNPRAI